MYVPCDGVDESSQNEATLFTVVLVPMLMFRRVFYLLRNRPQYTCRMVLTKVAMDGAAVLLLCVWSPCSAGSCCINVVQDAADFFSQHT